MHLVLDDMGVDQSDHGECDERNQRATARNPDDDGMKISANSGSMEAPIRSPGDEVAD